MQSTFRGDHPSAGRLVPLVWRLSGTRKYEFCSGRCLVAYDARVAQFRGGGRPQDRVPQALGVRLMVRGDEIGRVPPHCLTVGENVRGVRVRVFRPFKDSLLVLDSRRRKGIGVRIGV